jgi:hypothetical protein
MRLCLLILLALMGPVWACEACEAGDTEMVQAQLLFGRSVAPEPAWADFLATSVTPRFPDGLTALDGRGQWLSPRTGRISHEESSVLILLVAPAADLRARLDAVREEYKARFQQQSVGLVTSVACVGF